MCGYRACALNRANMAVYKKNQKKIADEIRSVKHRVSKEIEK